jgi:hypothetical protein
MKGILPQLVAFFLSIFPLFAIPKMTQKLADRRVQSAKNQLSQRGLYCLDTTPFAIIDFWQLSIPPIGQLLSHLGYTADFDDILLVVHYNHAHWKSVHFLKELYSPFQNIVFYGEGPSENMAEAASPLRKEMILVPTHEGWYYSRVVEDVLIRFPNYRGYLFMQDDVLMHFWNYHHFDKDRIWFAVSLSIPAWDTPRSWDIHFDKRKASEELYNPWHDRWWKEAIGISLANSLMAQMHPKNQEIAKRNMGEKKGAGMVCDLFYLPQRLREEAIPIAALFKDVFCEVAIPMMLVSLDDFENWEIMKGFWGYSPDSRGYPLIDPAYPSQADWVHALKFSDPYFQELAKRIKKENFH